MCIDAARHGDADVASTRTGSFANVELRVGETDGRWLDPAAAARPKFNQQTPTLFSPELWIKGLSTLFTRVTRTHPREEIMTIRKGLTGNRA